MSHSRESKLSNHRRNIQTVLYCSAFMVIFYLCTAQFYFAGGAGSFFTYANVIISGKHTLDITQREIGFPLMIVLSGFPWTGSIIGITLIHAIMGLLTPLLVYIAIGKSHPRAALAAGLMCVLSLTPYQYIKMMYHDQTYLFFTTLSVTMLACYARSGKPVFLYALMLASYICSFTRPTGNLSFPILLVCAYLAQPKPIRHYLICVAIFALLAFANYQHRFYILGVTDKHAIPSYTGHQIFYNVYLNAAEYGIPLAAQLGPAMKTLHDEIQKEFSPNPTQHPAVIHYKDSAPRFYETTMNMTNAAEFAQRFYDHPLVDYNILFLSIPSITFDSNLFLHASWEVVRQHPWYPVQYTLRNLTYFFLAPGYNHPLVTDDTLMQRHSPEYYPRVDMIAPEEGLTETAKAEMAHDPLNSFFGFLKTPEMIIHHLWRAGYNTLNRLSVLLMGIGVTPLLFAGLRRWSALTITIDKQITIPMLGACTLLLYNALVTCLFVDPLYRYQYMTMPVQIICAGYGLVVLNALIKARMKKSSIAQ